MNKEQIEKLARFKELRQAATNASFDCGEFDADDAYEAYRALALKANELNEQVDKFVEELLADHSLSAQDEVLTDERLDKIASDFIPGSTVTAGSLRRFGRAVEFEALAAAASSPAVAVEPVAQMICPNCGKNRFKETCPSTGNCPMIADAHLLAPPALAGSQVQAAGDVPWRVAEFWSSANPGQKCLMLAKDEQELSTWGRRSDFIRWCSPDPKATQKPNADCSGEPANCPDNEGYGCACDPMNKAAEGQP